MRRLLIGAGVALGLTAAPALAQYPEKDLQGIIQWGAGGSTDVVMRAVTPAAEEVLGEDIVMTNRTGGVGAIAVQLAKEAGATVIGIASEANHGWLEERGATPVTYGDGVAERVREAAGGEVDALIDAFGGGYVDMALELGVAPERINTIIDFAAAQEHEGVKTEGTSSVASAEVLAELAAKIERGTLVIPIAAVYPLEDVRDAYREIEQRHTRGKIVLEP